VRQHAFERPRHSSEIQRLDEQRRVAGLPVPHEAPELLFIGQVSLRRLLLERVKRAELTLGGDHLFHSRRADRPDELVLEVGIADVEAEAFHVVSCQVRPEAGPFETAPEFTLLSGIAKAGEREVQSPRAEPLQEPSDRLCAADRHDGDALRIEITTTALSQRFQRELVADSLDEYDRTHGSKSLPGCSRSSLTIVAMPYDEDLADRIRELLGGEPSLSEQKMFGGLAFLIGGNMAVAARGEGGILVRVDPAESDTLVAKTSARPMEMRGREMQGWLLVDADDLGAKRQLAKWVERGATFARSLPAKR
jgi:TfoX N-terminal domain